MWIYKGILTCRSHTSLPDVVESQVLMRIDKVVESYPIYNMTLTKESLNYTEAKAQGRRQPAGMQHYFTKISIMKKCQNFI